MARMNLSSTKKSLEGSSLRSPNVADVVDHHLHLRLGGTWPASHGSASGSGKSCRYLSRRALGHDDVSTETLHRRDRRPELHRKVAVPRPHHRLPHAADSAVRSHHPQPHPPPTSRPPDNRSPPPSPSSPTISSTKWHTSSMAQDLVPIPS
ncbi:actin cytoskeleton-regulatory complex protein PAN1 [Striga asiatica]|uniref:Actin cytoskeleton-regulatory complex protein PAN1 n=1 Tax=Striga asiatica TaxID=4170 RepID=A0A5A7R9V2_STRAF|nr:actin cytoskeleton-regulatory complex protein PAN1 [Striga asiatica]